MAPNEFKELSYSAVEPKELLPTTLSPELTKSYLELLELNRNLYDGHLGRMQFPDYVLPMSHKYKPYHAKPYPISRSIEDQAKTEIQRLIHLDVIEQICDSEVASPAFFIAKPNGSLRLLIDFRALNKYLRRSPYYVPRIRNILLRLSKAKCITTLDANMGYMGYYARRLDRQSRPLTCHLASTNTNVSQWEFDST